MKCRISEETLFMWTIGSLRLLSFHQAVYQPAIPSFTSHSLSDKDLTANRLLDKDPFCSHLVTTS
jgi:hypothetical protein